MIITSQFKGKCRRCGNGFAAGTQIEYDTELRTAFHIECVVEEGYPANESEEAKADRLNYRNYTWDQLTKRANPYDE